MMKEYSNHLIQEISPFPYRFSDWMNYDSSMLRSILYSPDNPDLCNPEHSLVGTYDDMVEWFLSWRDTGEDGFFADMDPDEFITYHLGRTILPVRLIEEKEC